MIIRYSITDGKADVNCTVISVVPILTSGAKIPLATSISYCSSSSRMGTKFCFPQTETRTGTITVKC